MYTKLSEFGKKFIKHVITETGDNKLSGNKTMPNVDFTKYFEVYNLPSTTPTDNFNWKSNVISDSNVFVEKMIAWYDQYAKEYEMDANILAAQCYAESKYRVWDFSVGKTKSTGSKYPAAFGLTQFLMMTIYGIVAKNSYNVFPKFSQDEIDNLMKNITEPIKSYTELNKPILLQNIMDHPELMIKAQCRYMKYCANKSDSLASSALFGYNRGPEHISKVSYTNTINNAKNDSGYEKEGIDYVFKIFAILGDKDNSTGVKKPKGYYFGYDNLGMNAPPNEKAKTFDEFNADVKNNI